MNQELLAADERTTDAVLRNIQIIGEVMKHIPDAVWRDARHRVEEDGGDSRLAHARLRPG